MSEQSPLGLARFRFYEFEESVPWLAIIESMKAEARAPAPVTDRCPCYQCSEPVEVWDPDKPGKRVMNNLHGELRPCEECGRAKTEYVDRYTWGYYECWWCNDRTAEVRTLARRQPA